MIILFYLCQVVIRDSTFLQKWANTSFSWLTSVHHWCVYFVGVCVCVCRVPWRCLIVDEGHRLKNSSSVLYRQLKEVCSAFSYNVLMTIMTDKYYTMACSFKYHLVCCWLGLQYRTISLSSTHSCHLWLLTCSLIQEWMPLFRNLLMSAVSKNILCRNFWWYITTVILFLYVCIPSC